MKVLIQTRPGMGTRLTGDVTQVRMTAEALQRLGVEVGFSDALEPDTKGFDVVHLFSTLRPHYTYLRLRHLVAKRVPTVVSTIYWEWEPAELREESIVRLGRRGYHASRLMNALRRRAPGRLRYRLEKSSLPYAMQARFYGLERQIGANGMRRYVYDNAGVLLPNSEAEYDFLADRFGTANDYVVVPNAVDPHFGDGDRGAFVRKFGLSDFVLCCAVVQIRKNQRHLIEAANALSLPLVLVGSEEPRYGRLCREIAGPTVRFLGQLQGAELRNAYAAARTHALVSFYETPGLASLEAAISGNTIVASDRGSPREYFGDHAFYCQPTEVESIKAALSKAFAATADPALKQRVLGRFTWEKTAEATLEGYRRAIAKAGAKGA
ncbi:MAG: glycosyltransferase [Alphaproteobacteria bacterium]|nr:glycosyltransferase [Alphaproteobacteria bacterium]